MTKEEQKMNAAVPTKGGINGTTIRQREDIFAEERKESRANLGAQVISGN